MVKNYWHIDRTLESKGIVVLKDVIGSYYSYTIYINNEENVISAIESVKQLFMLPVEAREQALTFLNSLLNKFRV